jgi:hypothetical protein
MIVETGFLNNAISWLTALDNTLSDQEGVLSAKNASGLRSALEILHDIVRVSRFHVGDVVQLKETYDCSNAPGWKYYEEIFVKGTRATVRRVDYWARNEGKEKSRYRYLLAFDSESADDSSLFEFGEEWLESTNMEEEEK